MHQADNGAFTGEVWRRMLLSLAASTLSWATPSDALSSARPTSLRLDKVKAALAAGLVPILCVGETVEEREAGRTESVVFEQLALACRASSSRVHRS